MKRTNLMLAFLMLTIVMLAQEKVLKSKKERRTENNTRIEARIDSLVQSGNYTVLVQSASPMGWQTIQLTSEYKLCIKGDSVEVNLPYYGRAYTVDYTSGEGGIKINSDMENYLKERKRKLTEITFNTTTQFNRYQFRISITTTGYATIFVNSNNRQAITFNGILNHVGL